MVGTTGIPLGTADMTAFLSKITGNFDGLFGIFFGKDGVTIGNQAFDLGLTKKYKWAGDGAIAESTNLPALGNKIEGFVGINRYLPVLEGVLNTPSHKKFLDEAVVRLKQIDPSGPLPDRYVQSNFEAMNALKLGMQKSGFRGREDTMKLIEALEGLEMKEGDDFPQGDKVLRKEDHQAFIREFVFEIKDGKSGHRRGGAEGEDGVPAGLQVPRRLTRLDQHAHESVCSLSSRIGYRLGHSKCRPGKPEFGCERRDSSSDGRPSIDALPDGCRPGSGFGAVLRTEGLTMRFGGLTALDKVDFEIAARRDPRDHRAERGRQEHLLQLPDRRAASDLGAHSVQRRGHHRASPRSHLPQGHRALLPDHQHPAQRHHPGERPHRRAIAPARLEHAHPPQRLRDIIDKAEAVLESVGLRGKAEELAANLSHGEQRNLEIGIALATEPQLLCLDEPTAGMSTAETHDTMALVRRIAENLTILIVEHDMQVVMELAQRITVLHYGASAGGGNAGGDPAELRRVLEVYLKT